VSLEPFDPCESGDLEAGAVTLVGLGSTLDDIALSAGTLSEIQGWDTLDSVAESGGQVYTNVRGGSGDLANVEALTIDPALLLHPTSGRAVPLPDSAPGGQDKLPQAGLPNDVIAAVARLPIDLGELRASAEHDPALLASLCACVVEYATWSPGPLFPKDHMSRFSELLCKCDGKWYCRLRGCAWARKGQQREDRAQWHVLTNHLGFRVSCDVWYVLAALRFRPCDIFVQWQALYLARRGHQTLQTCS